MKTPRDRRIASQRATNSCRYLRSTTCCNALARRCLGDTASIYIIIHTISRTALGIHLYALNGALGILLVCRNASVAYASRASHAHLIARS